MTNTDLTAPSENEVADDDGALGCERSYPASWGYRVREKECWPLLQTPLEKEQQGSNEYTKHWFSGFHVFRTLVLARSNENFSTLSLFHDPPIIISSIIRWLNRYASKYPLYDVLGLNDSKIRRRWRRRNRKNSDVSRQNNFLRLRLYTFR